MSEYNLHMIEKAMRMCLIEAAFISLLLLIIFIVSAFLSKPTKKTTYYVIASFILLLVSVFSFLIPVLKDYSSNSIVQAEGIYNNVLGDSSKSLSSINGEYSVTLEVDENTLKLRTAPWMGSEYFPTGKYRVIAWYAENSKRLLYIEVLDIIKPSP